MTKRTGKVKVLLSTFNGIRGILLLLFLLCLPLPALSATVTAKVVALDQFLTFNRLGAVNPTGMIFALRRDVVVHNPGSPSDGLSEVEGGILQAGKVRLRDDKRPRPIALRVNEGDTLSIEFQNLLNPVVPSVMDPVTGINMNDQPATRTASIHIQGLELVNSIDDDGSNVGRNSSALAAPGQTRTYSYHAVRENGYVLTSGGANIGGEGTMGALAFGLFGIVNVEPAGSVWHRSQLTEEEMSWATTGYTEDGHPLLDYNAVYPGGHKFSGKPIIKILNGNEIYHSDLNAIISEFTKVYSENPTNPNRQEPFREFSVIFHDEIKAIQAFDLFRDHNFEFTLHSVRDGFAINYGTGGVGAEIIANRLGVGPMADCVECKYEEFFLTSWAVGDPAMIVDVPANTIDENRNVIPGLKATKAFYPDDPSNVFHSYMSDHVKIRNIHVGKEHHIFHLHAHQWLANPDDDNSDYLDSQAIGPGSQYTYEIAYNGSGNRNKTAGDSIFHCHFYPHFAQGMWALWRVHDVFETGTKLDANGIPLPGTRALPDGEIMAGTPIPGLIPLPELPMMPMPAADVEIVNGQPVVTKFDGDEELGNPGYPFFIPGVAGHRPPTPPLDLEKDGGLPRHIIVSGTAESHETPYDFNKELLTADVIFLEENGVEVEEAAMDFHAQQWHPTFTPEGVPAMAEFNGLPPVQGAPYAQPCRTDGGSLIEVNRTYRAAVIELDMNLNKVGWHFNQSRILALEDDVNATLNKTRPPEPLVMRANSGDCIDFYHTNLIPNIYQQDDFQVKTPTDVIGQHIHLVKFDVTSADGSGNGWNYEDGTFSPDEVLERIHAINAYNDLYRPGTPHLAAVPGFNGVLGARTSIQRWYMDPVLNNAGEDRGMGNVYTHDHFGPSTHQQAGLYGTLLGEPAGSTWRDSDTGIVMGSRGDGGPTSWNADILLGDDSYREFYLEFADFQLAYSTPGLPRAQGGNAVPVNPPGMKEVGLPFIFERPDICPNGEPNVAGCPEAISADDVGTFSVNYRNEPIPLRVRDPKTNTQSSGVGGDLSYAFSSKVNRADAKMNQQPNDYPPLTADVDGRDPYTPLLRAYDGDKVNIRLQVGATEEGHVASFHGLKWLFNPDAKNSGYRNAQMMGISEQFQLKTPVTSSGVRVGDKADYLYATDSSVDGYWNGMWGLMRSYATLRSDLQPLPNNPVGPRGLAVQNRRDFIEMCPRSAPVRNYDITAISASITFNSRTGNGPVQGPLNDPTGIRYVHTSDLDGSGNLLPGVPEEPLILRAAAGECIDVTLRSQLASNLPDLDGFSVMPPIVDHFNANQVAPSSSVGLHPQLVAFDVTRSDGANIGMNRRTQTTKLGDSRPVRYRWYAGDVQLIDKQLVATPIEFGGTNLISSDRIKHSNKGAVGALIIEPEGATWELDEGTRASATVYANGTSFREFVLVMQDDINMRDGSGAVIPNVAEEDEAEDSGHRAINYKSEPIWLRMGYDPDADPEFTGSLDFTDVLSNSLVGGDPETPIFTAAPGQAVRFRVLQPNGHARNSSFTLHGHVWQKTPYLNDSTMLGDNPSSIYMGAQEGHGPANHFDIIPEHGAGGSYQISGDYLYRDLAPVHFDNGIWGIFRVE